MAQQPQGEPAEQATVTPARHRHTLAILVAVVLLIAWYLASERITPYSANARSKAYEIKVVPDISGYVDTVQVKKHQQVAAGDTLFTMEKRRFELAVTQAEANLALAGQQVGSDTAEVASATAGLTEARSRLDEAKKQAARILTLEEKGIVAKAQGDEARAQVEMLTAQLGVAESKLEQAKQLLGTDGLSNPRVQLAQARLEQAMLDLSRTELKSPSEGYVGSLKLDRGSFAQAGQPVMTFLSTTDIWIEAYMTENNLAHIEPGDSVEVAFDGLPGEIYKGEVKSIAVGVSTGKVTAPGELAEAEKAKGWLRSPQRFAVVIALKEYPQPDNPWHGPRHNGQADVVIFTGDNLLWNGLAKLWIRLMSILSYLY